MSRSLLVRAILAVVVLVVAGFALAHTAGMVFANRAPATALKFAPSNAAALSKQALTLLETDPKGQQDRAAALARRAIARDPTDASALAVIGLTARRPEAARRAIAMSQGLSRRSLRTQLWLIEDAVSRDDIDAALVHYDIALRTSQSAPGILFPILVEAVADPALVPPIARVLAKRPQWGGLYLQQLAQSGTAYAGGATLFADLIRRGIEPGLAATDTLFSRLIAAKRYDDAWRLYAARRPGASRGGLRNTRFGPQPQSPSPFEWQVPEGDSLTVTLDGMLTVESSAGDGGDAVRQIALLRPGPHRLSVTTGGIAAPADAIPYLKVVCIDGPELVRLALPAGEGAARAAGGFSVPAGCPAQVVSLTVVPTLTGGNVSGRVREVRID